MIEVNFNESVNYLLSLGNEVSAMKLGLDNIRKLLATLGNPENNYLKVQVAGTNGKGSVCAFLDSICVTAGIRTGTFTSPHLISITERVRVNGVDISEDDFARHATHVRETADRLVADGELLELEHRRVGSTRDFADNVGGRSGACAPKVLCKPNRSNETPSRQIDQHNLSPTVFPHGRHSSGCLHQTPQSK